MATRQIFKLKKKLYFPSGAVDETPAASAEDVGSLSLSLWSRKIPPASEQRSPGATNSPRAATPEAQAPLGVCVPQGKAPQWATGKSSPQLEEALTHQWRPSATTTN